MKTKQIPVPENWQKLKYHAYACLIEFGAGIDGDGLAANMRRVGYLAEEAIILIKGKKGEWLILDGRHRHAKAIEAEVTPTFREFLGTENDALVYLQKELFRRHMTPSQRAMFVADLMKLRKDPEPGDYEFVGPLPASRKKFTNEDNNTQLTQREAAELGSVSHPEVGAAIKVQEQGTEALKQAVRTGDISVTDAAKIVDQPATVQDRAAKAVEEGKAKTVSQAAKTCARCLRLGTPVKDCPQCKELREAKRSESKPRAPKEEKNGQPVFNPDEADQIFITARLLIDKLYGKYGLRGKANCIKEDDSSRDIMKQAKAAASALKGRARELDLEAKANAREAAKAKKE